jgi:hypothetical protein
MDTQRKVTITIHTNSDEPYWSITDDHSGEVIHDFIDGWYGEGSADLCESTTWRMLREYCASKGWSATEAWS